ncbi:MAG: hypothetical protein JKZ03_00030 [Flavobacteriaceae bacterium]|nr:hypothetical protein [Flavobacteriaceae bacterium]
MKAKKWDTIISNCEGLYFERLTERGKGVFEVVDHLGNNFEVILDDLGPYMILEEKWLNHGVSVDEIGWTYVVEGGGFPKLFADWVLEEAPYVHYVVITYDMCLEILASRPPIIKPMNLG